MKHHLPFILIFTAACGGSANSGPKTEDFQTPDVLEHGGDGGSTDAIGGSAGTPGVAGSSSGGAGGTSATDTGGTGGVETTPDAGVAGTNAGGAGGTDSQPTGGSGGVSGNGGTGSAGSDQGGTGGSAPIPECDNGATRCSTSIQTQACVDGQWQDSDACNFACEEGECVGSCTNGSETCYGLDSVICVNHEYVAQTTCDYVCSGGSCSGECIPGSVDCDGVSQLTCGTDGIWDSTECPFVCSAGQCTGVCTPGDARCSSSATDEFETCNAQGQWEQTACSAAPNMDAVCQGTAECISSCQIGFYDCDGNAGNGCETADGPSNCGGCNVQCSTNGSLQLSSISIPSGTAAFDVSQDLAVWAVDNGNFVYANTREFGGEYGSTFSVDFTGRPGTIVVKRASGSTFVIQRNTKYVKYDALTGAYETISDNEIGSLNGSENPRWTVNGQFFYYLTGSSEVHKISLSAPHTDVLVGTYLQADALAMTDDFIALEYKAMPRYEAVDTASALSSSWDASAIGCAPLANDVMFAQGDTLISNGCKFSLSSHTGASFGTRFDKLVTGDGQHVFYVNNTSPTEPLALRIIKKWSIQGAGSLITSWNNPGNVLQLKVSGNYLYWIDSSHVWRTAK